MTWYQWVGLGWLAALYIVPSVWAWRHPGPPVDDTTRPY